MKKEIVCILSLLIFLMAECGASKEKAFTSDFKYSYGVFLDANSSDIMSGVNQECLFTSIDFSRASFKQSNEKDYEYFEKYIERCVEDNMDVYLLEYSVDGELISQIQDYCEKNHYFYYISPSIELKATHSGL